MNTLPKIDDYSRADIAGGFRVKTGKHGGCSVFSEGEPSEMLACFSTPNAMFQWVAKNNGWVILDNAGITLDPAE